MLAAAPASFVAWLFFAVIPGLPGIGWVALVIVAVALAGAARAAADLAGARPVEGEVVKLRPQGRVYWVAVDDGNGSTVRAWRVDAAIYRQVSEGDVIRVRVSRIFRYVSGLQLVSHRPQVDVEASLPDWQRAEGNDRRRAVVARPRVPAPAPSSSPRRQRPAPRPRPSAGVSPPSASSTGAPACSRPRRVRVPPPLRRCFPASAAATASPR